MTEKDLVKVLRESLPSKKILEYARNGAVRVMGELIYLKKKDNNPSEFIRLNKTNDPHHSYDYLNGKSIIIDHLVFNGKEREAILEYSNTFSGA